MAESPISHYEIIAREVDGQGALTVSTSTSTTLSNVTGLLPGTAYKLTVVAVSEGGNVLARSPESVFVILTTGVTGIHLNRAHGQFISGLKLRNSVILHEHLHN